MKTFLLTVAALLTVSVIGTAAADPAHTDPVNTNPVRFATAGALLLLDAGQMDTVTAGAGLPLPTLNWIGGECAVPMLSAQLPNAGVRPTGAAAGGGVFNPSLGIGGSTIGIGVVVVVLVAP